MSSSSSHEKLHEKNPYKANPPDFKKLRECFPEFAAVTTLEANGKVKINWKDFHAVKMLTLALLRVDFGLSLSIPDNTLCPPVPNRLNYLCWISDLIGTSPMHQVLDIGTGCSCIYPLLGTRLFNWKFVGTDVNSVSVTCASMNVSNNNLGDKITVVPVSDSEQLQLLIENLYMPQFLLNTEYQLSLADVVKKSSVKDLKGPISQLFATQPSTSALLRDREAIGHFKLTVDSSVEALQVVAVDEIVEDVFKSYRKNNKRQRSDDSDEDQFSTSHVKKSKIVMELSATEEASGLSPASLAVPVVFDAMMTNPPFYDLREEIVENDHSICTGNSIEMRTTGGEVCFIAAIIWDSLLLRGAVRWYSTMVGKKSSLAILIKMLLHEGVPRHCIFTTTFAQGVTYRWGLAWTFIEEEAAACRTNMAAAAKTVHVPDDVLLSSTQTAEALYGTATDAEKSSLAGAQLSGGSEMLLVMASRRVEASVSEFASHHSTSMASAGNQPKEVIAVNCSPFAVAGERAIASSVQYAVHDESVVLNLQLEVINSSEVKLCVTMQHQKMTNATRESVMHFRDTLELDFLRTNRKWRRQLRPKDR